MTRPRGIFCPHCGTRNLATAQACRSCHEALPQPEDLERLWGPTDRGAASDPSLQETRAIHTPPPPPSERDRDRGSQAPSDPPLTVTHTPVSPPPAARFSPARPTSAPVARPVAEPSRPTVAAPPPVRVEEPAPLVGRPLASYRSGPHGCILGIVAVLLICAIGGSLLWLVGRPLLNNSIKAEVDRGIATQVAGIERLPVRSSGEIVLTEADINDSIQSYEGSFDPMQDPRVTIEAGRISVRFKLYGTTSTYHGDLDIRGGRIEVVDAEVDGPAGQFLDAGDLAQILEAQFADLMNRSDLRPTDVRIRDGRITITTEPSVVSRGSWVVSSQ